VEEALGEQIKQMPTPPAAKVQNQVAAKSKPMGNNQSVGNDGASVGEPEEIIVGLDQIDDLDLTSNLHADDEMADDELAEIERILEEADFLK